MSWQDKLQNIKFSIKTGDGKIYYPLWKNAEKSKEYNFSKYDFIRKKGSLIDRKNPQSSLIPLVFWFQGEDNIEQSQQFENSADDSRAWEVTHPFYGKIKGQPVNLKRNDFNYNVTQVTVDFWESIDIVLPESSVSLKDQVAEKVINTNALSAAMFVENSNPEIKNIDSVKQSTNIISSEFEPDVESFNDYNNAATKSLSSVDNLVNNPFQAISDIQNVMSLAANFNTNISNKLSSFKASYNVLKNSINNLFDKFNFESQCSSLISYMCLSAVNPLESDYVTRNDIEEVYSIINETYSDYLQVLDENQVDIYQINESWSANIQIQQNLSDLVTLTLHSLYIISFNAKQERQYELEKDSNIILLAHRFLGPDSTDANIIRFREINNVKNDKVFKLKKGTLVKYFV